MSHFPRAAPAFLIAVLLGSCATAPAARPAGKREFYVPAVDEVLYRTWLNPALEAPEFPPKLILYPWGLVEQFAHVDDAVASWTGTSIIVQRWVDDSGSTWYREYRRGSQAPGFRPYFLDKVSGDETTLESVSSNSGWPSPSELGASANPSYVIYRRLETP